jgi:uncharacterized protein YfaS (alpha-2-macroglobulin family)
MKRTVSSPFVIFTAIIMTFAGWLQAQVPAPGTVKRPRDAGAGTVIVPDRFLRSWDPVTIFFNRDIGGKAGTPEDDPGRLLILSPDHPGAYTWVDPRTLQLRPADPWSPLERYTWTVDGTSFTLATLMSPPVKTIPAADATGLDPVTAITLVFPDPLDAGDLARMVTIELRPLPGLERDQVRWLTYEDFEIKPIERSSRSDQATFVLALETPIPMGTRAIVHLRLSLDDDSTRSFAEIPFATAEPFRVTRVGTRRTRFPVTPEGSRYTADQAINGGSDDRTVIVELSATPQAINPVQARNLVRLTPAVDNLSFRTAGKTLEVSGDFKWDTLYRVTIAASPISDRHGRPLVARGQSDVFLFFPRRPAYLRWRSGHGVVERFGSQMVPVEGRGHERFDLRIFPVDPVDRSFWPFPAAPVTIDESKRPPGPGETPARFTAGRHIRESELRQHLSALGSPAVSTMVELPLRREGSSATFGLDLAPHLQRLAPAGAPGHYLIGLRPLDASSNRQWMRIQVTDLSLTTTVHGGTSQIYVTSLATGKPVAGATVSIQGTDHGSWTVHASGTTDQQGGLSLPTICCRSCTVLRLVVSKGDDYLALDASQPPEGFADNSWSAHRRSWLSCYRSAPRPEEVSHIFTERPIYRPDEPVHIKGYVRTRSAGKLHALDLYETFVVVEGPGNLVWRYPVTMTVEGSFYHEFNEADRPTGVFSAHLEGRTGKRDGPLFRSRRISFQLQAYRIPRFEVNLHGPDRVPLDRELEVTLTATYYAGGRVADRPVHWQVTQFPYTWTPEKREGFFFSSDARFSRSQRFEATAAIDKQDRTDDQGSAKIVLNPALEPTAQPRTYVVEATVTGADDQTVTSSRRVVALPSFILGMKVPRYIERATAVTPEVIVVGTDNQLLAGEQVTVRLLHRQWHSYLRASDFSDGEARYVTDVVDDKIYETTVTSAAEPVKVELPIEAAGVYVVELEASDRVGRAQTVAVDLYAGGDEPVTWDKPISRVFNVRSDKSSYDPGDSASFVLESPFQKAEVLVIVEAPEGNRYQWLPVRNGSATFSLPVSNTWVPKLPVHFVLMRGRVGDTRPLPGLTTDLGKPATLANTTWIKVNPVDNRVKVELGYPAQSLPGRTVDVTISLADAYGNPLAGEVTLWLVDQAVLALGKEQRLDPLPDFITGVSSHLLLRDSRNLPFGFLPFAENPGGEMAQAEAASILDRATVRRNFKPVPFYDPLIMVGPDGTRTVQVGLPDNLTNFKIRAKVVSGLQRFGYGTGHLEVRLPLIVQPALPRFVRPRDQLVAAAIGRVVEGPGGPGAVEIQVEGLTLEEAARQDVVWVPNQPHRIDFQVAVPTPQYDAEGQVTTTEAVFRVGVERTSDGATDAFEVKVPICDDRRVIVRRLLHDLVTGEPVTLPEVEDEPRPGTVRRSLLVSNQPALVRMAAGLSFLLEYPYGCTEQRLSRARAYLALQKLRDQLFLQSSEGDLERSVNDVLTWISQVVDSNGLVGYWPGSRGYVSLTAWSLQLLCEARDAGFTVNEETFETIVRSLEQAMRSDYSYFIDGESFAERCWALTALTRAGRFNPAYAAELARSAQYLNLESTAHVLQSFVAAGKGSGSTVEELAAQLWDGVVVRLYQGREVYGGLQDRDLRRTGLILPSETRAVAEVTRAIAQTEPESPRLQVLVSGLVTLGRGDGWGSTNANAAALLALAEVLQAPAPSLPTRQVEVSFDGTSRTLRLGSEQPLIHMVSTETGAGQVELLSAADDGPATVVRAETRWVPKADGSTVAAEARGFVVTRELQLVVAGAPPRRLPVEPAEQTFTFTVGDVIEDHVQVVNPADRHYVAVVVPMAAGTEPLNPNLATAPPEAKPAGTLTRQPSYAAYLDDHVAFYFDTLPKGTFDFYFRTRATIPGRFIQPAALAEMMYDESVRGHGNGARIEIVQPPEGE